MIETPKYTSEDGSSGSGMLITISIVCIAIGAFLIYTSEKNSPPELAGVGLGVLFGAAALILLYGLRYQISYNIYDDRIEIFSFSGKKEKIIRTTDIRSWSEKTKRNDNNEWTVLTLYTDATEVIISSKNQIKYSEIKDFLTTNKPNEQGKTLNWLDKRPRLSGYSLIILGAVLLYFTVSIFLYCRKPVLQSDLTIITYSIGWQQRRWRL